MKSHSSRVPSAHNKWKDTVVFAISKRQELVEVPGIEPGSFVSKTALLRA